MNLHTQGSDHDLKLKSFFINRKRLPADTSKRFFTFKRAKKVEYIFQHDAILLRPSWR